jgi:ATP-dependent protease ClpP protease subunit
MCYVLDTAKSGDVVTIHINNGGGSIDSAFQIINSMKNSKAHIIGKLSGTVASASTVISLYCHELIVADFTAFMIHNYSGGVVG